ncbi:putative uncharacterized protein [Clostridium sp. CAG:609]|nr:putative uncharacterized protein [Clostridium sp. CAG:609]
MAKEVIVTADTIKKRKKAFLKTKVVIGLLILVFLLIFTILGIVFNVNKFTITLDNKLQDEKGIILYSNPNEKAHQRKLFASALNDMDNISYDWIPKDVHTSSNGGSHNGDNYIAYTFYIENEGEVSVNYWYSIIIDDVIKRVDEAVRVIVFLNDEETVYAKINNETGEAEKNTEPFYKDDVVVLKSRNDFKVGDVDKFTIVIYLEGDDPDCLNDIIGGEIKMHMEIREEHLDE